MNIFDKINEWIENVESSIVTLITTLIPWLAPFLPAYFTYYHLTNMSIHVPWWAALPMAASVEFLGMAAVSTAFEVMRHNKQTQNRKKANKLPMGFPVVAYVFYVIVVITVNVVLELPMSIQAQQYAEIIAIALLTLISAPAFVIVISRHQRREIDGQTDKKPDKKPAIVTAKNGRKPVRDGRDYGSMSIDEIMQSDNVSERTAYRRKANANKNGHHKTQVKV